MENYSIEISVRRLVEFVLRSGSIDNRIHQVSADAMQEGSRIHRMIQKSMGPDYHAEVPLKYIYNTGRYDLTIEGRADGILDKFFNFHNSNFSLNFLRYFLLLIFVLKKLLN